MFCEPYPFCVHEVQGYQDTVNCGNMKNIAETPIAFFEKLKAYPNPFNPKTRIPFSIQEGQIIKISIFDINGTLVQDVSNQYFQPGNHYVKFSNKKLSSGIYFIMLNHKNGIETQKITFLK